MTNKTLASVLLGGGLLIGGPAPLAAPEQTYPGQPTQGKVWIENRGRREAVPVSLEDAGMETTLRVQVTGTATVAITAPTVFDTKHARQPWEYERIAMLPDDDPRPELNRLGREGWEATTQWITARGQLTIVLRRPR